MYIVLHCYFTSRNKKKKVRYTEYYLIFSTITCIPDIVEVCGLGAINTPIFSSETLPPQNDHVTNQATPQKMSWLRYWVKTVQRIAGSSLPVYTASPFSTGSNIYMLYLLYLDLLHSIYKLYIL